MLVLLLSACICTKFLGKYLVGTLVALTLGASLGVFRIKTINHILHVSVNVTQMKGWSATLSQISKCTGYRCLVMVMKHDSGGTHSVVCIRRNTVSSIAAQNSLGEDNRSRQS